MWVSNAASPILPETPESAHATDAFSVDSQTTGTKGTNLFAGFTSPALTIVNGNVSRSSGTHKFAKGTTDVPAFISAYACMDSEITFRMGVGKVVLRYNAAAGSGLTCCVFNYGTVTIGLQASGISVANYETVGSFQYSVDLTSFGWTAINEDDVFTFGVVGLTFYAKWNGVTVLSKPCLQQLAPGTAMIWPHPGFDGVGDTSLVYLPQTLYSNRAKKMIDLRDFGLKSSQTTGSISSGSNQLTVANASGFSLGDSIIVATGGEAGAGLRGTMGVGGAWPTLSYADATTMNADTTQAENTPCWIVSTGYVYRYKSGVWTINRSAESPDGDSLDFGDYYTQMAVPNAIVATITGKAGNILTLDQTASASTSGAEVHFDNYSAFTPVTAASDTYLHIRIPSGDYALAQVVSANFKHGFTVKGYGPTKPRLFAPKGSPFIGVWFSQSDSVTIESLKIEGNAKSGGAGEHAQYFRFYEGTGRASSFRPPVLISSSTNSVLRNLDLKDLLNGATGFENSRHCLTTGITLELSARMEVYGQWAINCSGCSDTVIEDCVVTKSPGLLKTFESFVGTNNIIRRCGGENVLLSMNNNWNWLMEDVWSNIKANAFSFWAAGIWIEPVINVNNNAYQNGRDGKLRNPIIIQDYVSTNHDTLPAISVGVNSYGVTIEGQYKGQSTPFVDGLGGFLKSPDYGVIDTSVTHLISGGHSVGTSAGIGLILTAPDTIVSGLRLVGAAKSGAASFTCAAEATGVTVADCIADSFAFQAGNTKSGNRTNTGASVP